MQLHPSAPLPVAYASLPWQLVLAIIAFNIVAGMISKRKQRQAKSAKANPRTEAGKAEARRDKDDSRDGEIRRSLEETRLREAAEAKRRAADRQARQAREEVLRAREEERTSEEPVATGTAKQAETTGRAVPPQPPRETPKPAGKGLLEQLARELGLELPQAPRPAPIPARAPVRPVETPSMRPQPGRQEIRRDTRRLESDETGEPSRSEGSGYRPAPAPMSAPIAEALVGPDDFTDPRAMRKAFILKVILDKPLALRRHR
jgi:hypothetical protein